MGVMACVTFCPIQMGQDQNFETIQETTLIFMVFGF